MGASARLVSRRISKDQLNMPHDETRRFGKSVVFVAGLRRHQLMTFKLKTDLCLLTSVVVDYRIRSITQIMHAKS